MLYAVARDGWAVGGEPMGPVPEAAQHPKVLEDQGLDLQPLFDAIINHVPAPQVDVEAPLVMQVNAIDYDPFVGRLAVGRVVSGKVAKKQEVFRKGANDVVQKGRLSMLGMFEGLKRVETENAAAGDLVVVAGLEEIVPGDTIVGDEETAALERIEVDEPTVTAIFRINDGPFSGKDGKYVTSRQIRDRLYKETRGNVSLRVEDTDTAESFRVTARRRTAARRAHRRHAARRLRDVRLAARGRRQRGKRQEGRTTRGRRV